MILGTVQLGKDYGVNNKIGKPSEEVSYQILDLAYNAGIRILDTGPMYGNSEKLIGRYFRKNGQRFKVATKFPDSIPEEENPKYEEIEKIVESSIARLDIDSAYCYYLHQFYQCKFPKLMNKLCLCKGKGLIENVGVSIYHPSELEYICKNLADLVDVVQIPYNVFSAHLWKNSLLSAKNLGIKIYARSIFLQGLVFMKPEDKFATIIGASTYISFIQKLAKNRNSSVAQVCYDAVAGNELIEDFIFGVDTENQLKNNLLLQTNYNPLSELEQNQIEDKMKSVPSDMINPTKWEKYR